MNKKREFTIEQIAGYVILDILDTEYDERKRGLNQNKVYSIYLGKDIQGNKVISDLLSQNFIAHEINDLIITKKGKKQLYFFHKKRKREDSKSFYDLIPTEYHLRYRLNVLEIFISNLFLFLSFSSLFYLLYRFDYIFDPKFFWIKVIFFIVLGFLLFFTFSFFYFSLIILVLRGISRIIKPIFSQISISIEDNIDKVSRAVAIFLLIGGTIICWGILGTKGLIGGIIFTMITEGFFRKDKIKEFIMKKFNRDPSSQQNPHTS